MEIGEHGRRSWRRLLWRFCVVHVALRLRLLRVKRRQVEENEEKMNGGIEEGKRGEGWVREEYRRRSRRGRRKSGEESKQEQEMQEARQRRQEKEQE